MSKTIERTDLRSFILADGTVTGLIAARLYAILAPPSPTLPYVVATMIAATPSYTHDGTAPFAEDLHQLDIFGATAASAQAVCDAIRAKVEGKAFTQGSTDFGAVFIDTETDNFNDLARDDGTAGYFQKTLELRVLINT